jgi:uncharacterized protein (DUF952 family)
MIYHIIKKKEWKKALQKGFYAAPSLAEEGFIHCSIHTQVAGVLQRYYKNETSLLLLHIDETLLTSSVQYEWAASVNEMFPHIFGPLNTTAVVKAVPLK